MQSRTDPAPLSPEFSQEARSFFFFFERETLQEAGTQGETVLSPQNAQAEANSACTGL